VPVTLSRSPSRSSSSALNTVKSLAGFNNILRVAPPETIETFGSDCLTPKTQFVLGETVCAKTTFVTETDRFVNWFGPNGHAFGAAGQTDITTNQPQDFLYTPTDVGAWSVAIADSTNSSIVSTNFDVVAPGPIVTYKLGCVISSDSFLLGETVCARVTGGTLSPRRLTFVDPSGAIRQVTAITNDPQDISYQLPATQTSTVNGQIVDNRGTWRVHMINGRGVVLARALFTVTDPAAPSADLSLSKSVLTGNEQVAAGSSGKFQIYLTNNGPNPATNVVLTDTVPANTTFLNFTQTSGPTFNCTTPSSGETGTISCTKDTLARGASVAFDFAFQVNTGVAAGTTISNTASASSDVPDPNASDNSSSASVTVASGAGTGGCTLTCPDDVTTTADTTDGGGNPGAVVHYGAATTSGTCGSVNFDHCNDCFFPVGTTVVNATADSGDSCSFAVTVNAAGAPTITCPQNQTANADNDCEAQLNAGTATATGDNVTVFATRSDGQPMYTCDSFGNCTRNSTDAPFAAGTTTITWSAYSHDIAGPYNATTGDEESHRTGSTSCTQTIVVNDVTPPNIGATDSSASADASCMAPVPDYSSTVTDNCACSSSDQSEACQNHPHITYTQTPAAGTMVGLGAHTVHIEANDGSSNNNGAGNTATKDVTFTVNDTTPPTITSCPANITTSNDPGTCAATVNPGMATATDNCDTTPTIVGTRSDNQPLTAPYPKGTTTITWTATDDAGNSSSCTQTVTVSDTEAPTMTFNGQTPSMWPPNHSYHTFTAANFIAMVSDNCDSLTVNDVYITSATSDEPENAGGSGNTLNDIVISGDCKSVQLRAERINTGNGRVYTIYFKLKDSSGNFTTGSAKVYSPKNQGETPGDDGPHTVTSGCP
jgi:uncharacterized repeat protein (TIGR01451 family)